MASADASRPTLVTAVPAALKTTGGLDVIINTLLCRQPTSPTSYAASRIRVPHIFITDCRGLSTIVGCVVA